MICNPHPHNAAIAAAANPKPTTSMPIPIFPAAPLVLPEPDAVVVFEGEDPPPDLEAEVVDEALAVVLNFSIPAVMVMAKAETEFPEKLQNRVCEVDGLDATSVHVAVDDMTYVHASDSRIEVSGLKDASKAVEPCCTSVKVPFPSPQSSMSSSGGHPTAYVVADASTETTDARSG